jgi:hypothetical protein
MHNRSLIHIINLNQLKKGPKGKIQLVSIDLWQYHMTLLIKIDPTKQM